MNKSKAAIAVSGIASFIQAAIGIALILIFGMCTIFCITDKTFVADTGVSFLVCCLIFDALGIWLIICARKTNKLIKEFKKYVAAISKEPTGYLPKIASIVEAPEDVVRKNMELMIKKKFFSNAYISRESNCIVVADKRVVEDLAGTEMLTVKCKCCGANNTIAKGTMGECDYCGSPFDGNVD